jgi:stress-induced morphogen
MTIPSPSRADRIKAAIQDRFDPSVVVVTDDSHHHAGHSGARPQGETHYSVLVVAEAFHGMSRVQRSRSVHALLQSEFGEPDASGMHALALTLRTPAEHGVA